MSRKQPDPLTFVPSGYSDAYGWAALFPIAALTTTSQRLANQPTDPRHTENLSKLSDFLASLPFIVQVTSGFRTSAVNTAVGGSGSSQHLNGLAADIKIPDPNPGVTNKDIAVYFWHYRDKIPELDQVIWYKATSHTHIGICPEGATGCPPGAVPGRGRGEFRVKDGGSTPFWTPSQADLDTYGAKLLIALGPPGSRWRNIAVAAGAVAAGAAFLGALWYFTGPR
jgi:hypothetical protein